MGCNEDDSPLCSFYDPRRPLPRPGGSSLSIGFFVHVDTGSRWVGKANIAWPPPAEHPGDQAESEATREAIGMLAYSVFGVEVGSCVGSGGAWL